MMDIKGRNDKYNQDILLEYKRKPGTQARLGENDVRSVILMKVIIESHSFPFMVSV